MKKLIFILIMALCLSFTSCEVNSEDGDSKFSTYRVDVVNVDNHDYVVARTIITNRGISIIHSESCPCKNKNIYKKVE